MLTLLTSCVISLTLCIYTLSRRYAVPAGMNTASSVMVSLMIATVCGLEQRSEPFWYLIGMNVSLALCIAVIVAIGNQEKLDWTYRLEKSVFDISRQLRDDVAKLHDTVVNSKR